MINKIVRHKCFDHFIFSVILINSIMLVLQTSISLPKPTLDTFAILEIIIMLIFIFEAILKITALRKAYFKSGWNCFDFAVTVVSSIPYVSFFSALRALRILRIIGKIRSLKVIVEAFALSIPSMISTFFLLLIIFLVSGIISVQLFGESFPDWFGNLGRALYSLFQIMTLESWSMGIVRPVMTEFTYAWVFFIPFILLSTFILLNFIIGIIVDSISELKKGRQENTIESQLENMSSEIKALRELIIKIKKDS